MNRLVSDLSAFILAWLGHATLVDTCSLGLGGGPDMTMMHHDVTHVVLPRCQRPDPHASTQPNVEPLTPNRTALVEETVALPLV